MLQRKTSVAATAMTMPVTGSLPVVLCAALIGLAGCGQKGPLMLPKALPAATSASAPASAP